MAKPKRPAHVARIRPDGGGTSPALRVLLYDARQNTPVRIRTYRTTWGGGEASRTKIDLSYEEAIKLADALMEAVAIHKDDALDDASDGAVSEDGEE